MADFAKWLVTMMPYFQPCYQRKLGRFVLHLYTDTASLVLALWGFDRCLGNKLISGSMNCFSMVPRCLLAEGKKKTHCRVRDTWAHFPAPTGSSWFLVSLHHDISTAKGDFYECQCLLMELFWQRSDRTHTKITHTSHYACKHRGCFSDAL